MSRRVVASAAAVVLLLGYAEVWAQRDSESARAERANRALARWLDEDVAYIITDEERQAFEALSTDEERAQFIEQFWLRRDPTPDTIENEYREEHYRRIAYANERFASGIPGWKTDRGRIYIIHGEPDGTESKPTGGTYYRTIQEGGGSTNVFPFERWRYRHIEGIGTNVEFEFVDPTMSGEYRLAMSPHEKDALTHIPGVGFTMWEELQEDPEQARLLRGTSEEASLRGSQFDRLELWARAFDPPDVRFTDLEEIVTARLSYNLLPFEMRADFVRITEETVYTPITLQFRNSDLAFQETQGIHQASVNIFGRVTGINGRVAQTFEDTVSISIPEALYQESLDAYRVYQKVVPLQPGRYKVDLVVEDLHSGNVGTLAQGLTVPRFPSSQLAMSSLILAHQIEPLPSRSVATGQFVLGSLKVRPSVRKEYRQGDDMYYWVQLYNLEVDENSHKPSATVETSITRDGREIEKIVEDSDDLSGAAQQMTVHKAISLVDYDPGEYLIQVRVTDNLSGEIASESASFVVLEWAPATAGK